MWTAGLAQDVGTVLLPRAQTGVTAWARIEAMVNSSPQGNAMQNRCVPLSRIFGAPARQIALTLALALAGGAFQVAQACMLNMVALVAWAWPIRVT